MTPNSHSVGSQAESLAKFQLQTQGWIVSDAGSGHAPYDLIVDRGVGYTPQFLRVQVKGTKAPREKQNSYVFNTKRRSTKHSGFDHYQINEIDIFALVALDTRTVVFKPAQEILDLQVKQLSISTTQFLQEGGSDVIQEFTNG